GMALLRPKGRCCRQGGPAPEKIPAIHRGGVHGASSRFGSRESSGRDLARAGSPLIPAFYAPKTPYVFNPGPSGVHASLPPHPLLFFPRDFYICRGRSWLTAATA